MKTLLLSPCILVSSALIATASPLWQLDFEGMTPNTPPPVSAAVAGAVNTGPQAVSNSVENATTLIHVVENFSAHGKTMSGKSLLFQKSTASTQEVGLLGATGDYTAWGDYELTFDLLVGAGISGQPVNVRLTPLSSSVSVLALVFDMNGGVVLSSSYSSTAPLTFSGAWDPTSINQIKLQVNSENQKALAMINGIFVGELDLDLADRDTNPLGISRVRFRNNSTNQLYASGFAIDNIMTSTMLSPIPEPGSVALLAAGLIGLGLLTRRQRIGR